MEVGTAVSDVVCFFETVGRWRFRWNSRRNSRRGAGAGGSWRYRCSCSGGRGPVRPDAQTRTVVVSGGVTDDPAVVPPHTDLANNLIQC